MHKGSKQGCRGFDNSTQPRVRIGVPVRHAFTYVGTHNEGTLIPNRKLSSKRMFLIIAPLRFSSRERENSSLYLIIYPACYSVICTSLVPRNIFPIQPSKKNMMPKFCQSVDSMPNKPPKAKGWNKDKKTMNPEVSSCQKITLRRLPSTYLPNHHRN